MTDLAELEQLAVDAVQRAGAVHRRARQVGLRVGSKGSALDLVTEVDREAERELVSALRHARPHDAIQGEEGASLEGSSLTCRTRSVLAERLDGKPPPLESVARELGLSPRSLQRGLSGEGTSFRTLLDGLRRDIALEYLEAGEAPISEIAYLVGFSETSAFTRAVTRWFGRSPVRIRQEVSAQPA